MTSRTTRARAVYFVGLFVVAIAALYVATRPARSGSGDGSSAPTNALARKRALASVHYTNSRLEEPRYRDEIFQAVDDAEECVRLAPKSTIDRANLAIVLLRLYDEKKLSVGADWIEQGKATLARAIAILDEVRRERADLAVAPFQAAMAQVRLGKLEAADPATKWEARFGEAAAAYLAIEDRSAALRYHLGSLQLRSQQYADAEKSLRRAVDLDPNHPNAYNALALSLARQGGRDAAEIERYFAIHRELQDKVGKPRALWDPDAVFDTAFPELLIPDDGAVAAVEGAARFVLRAGLPEATCAAPILRGDPAFVPGGVSSPDSAIVSRAALALFPKDGRPQFVRLASGAIAPSPETAPRPTGERVYASVSADLDGDHFLDFVLGVGGGIRALRALGPRAEDGYGPLPLPGAEADGLFVDSIALADLDADGDLDLLAIARAMDGSALRALRNDAEPVASPADTPPENQLFRPRFTPVAPEAGLVIDRADAPCAVVVLDVDGDNDVDVLVVGSKRSTLFANRRGMRFERIATLPGADAAAAGDLDGDGLPDVVLVGTNGIQLARANRGADGRIESLDARPHSGGRIALVDLENCGALDIVAVAPHRFTALRFSGGRFADVTARLFPDTKAPVGPYSIAVADLDADYDLDLVIADGGGPALVYENVGGERTPALAVTLRGSKSNRAGLGSKIEARVGGMRVRREVWSVPAFLGVGPRARIDGLFLKWPNGIDEADGDVPTGRWHFATERRGREGSCPFVFSWDGERFVFITDAIGAAPLGLYAAPGIWVPPNAHEWLRIRGDQCVARDGRYEIRFTEEMREVTYLDRVGLLAVDHPAGTSVYPDERFCFPPFPEKKLLTVSREIPIRSARDEAGRDLTAALAREDRVFTGPPLRIGYQGMAVEHALDLDLGDIPAGKPVRLFLTGWFAWTNSSINRAIADAGIRFLPPRIETKDSSGEWRTIIEDAGFPAGMQKTMCIDLSGKLGPAEHVVRIVTNLELHWDRAFVSFDDAPIETRVTEIAPSAATLQHHGWSRWENVGGRAPSEPNYAQATTAQVYDLHTGDYTRYGDVRELLDANDDRYAIFPTGDEIAISFDAKATPPLDAGWTRTFILDSSGWAKDADPNTFAPTTVEPLPFHGMSGYPYRADESYPDDEAHRRYRAEWNTRRVSGPRAVPVRGGIEQIHER